MIHNTAKRSEKFEETWVLKESPDWWSFIDLFPDGYLTSSKEIKFTSNGTEFSEIVAYWD